MLTNCSWKSSTNLNGRGWYCVRLHWRILLRKHRAAGVHYQPDIKGKATRTVHSTVLEDKNPHYRRQNSWNTKVFLQVFPRYWRIFLSYKTACTWNYKDFGAVRCFFGAVILTYNKTKNGLMCRKIWISGVRCTILIALKDSQRACRQRGTTDITPRWQE